MKEKNLILVGLGPHARRIYYPLLEKYAQQYHIRLRLLVDLEDQAERIRHYLAGRSFQPEQIFFAPIQVRNDEKLSSEILLALNQVAQRYPIHGMVISTEPKAHKSYALWALERNIDILMDKPITAPIGMSTDTSAARRIFEDYREIEDQLERSTAHLTVQCQRRQHAGYQFIKTYLIDFIKQYQVPISYIDIYHGDGMWCMPPELLQRENHPYKYGYGKLMHSGYHFIDLFVWLTEVNNLIESKKPDRADLFVKRFGAYDFLHQMTAADYRRLFGTAQFADAFEPPVLERARAFGELDVFLLCQLKREDVVTTTATINLQQNTFSRRAWTEPPEDVYKGNGRVRHERINIQVGPLLNIQVHSYQAYEVRKRDVETEGAGHEDHFDIYIFRNSGAVGGKTLEKFSLGEAQRRVHRSDASYLGHNEKGREINFIHFLNGQVDGAGLANQRMTNQWLSQIYTCIAQEEAGGVPHISFQL